MRSPVDTQGQRRTAILDAADRLLREHGWQKTTIGDIAREAHVGVGTVYLEFENKDAIVEAVSAGRHTLVLRAMMDAATRPKATHAARLTGMMDARVETFLSLRLDGTHAQELMFCVCPGVKTAGQRFFEAQHALCTQVLHEGHRDGEFHLQDPTASAHAVLRAYATFSPPHLFAEETALIRPALAALHQLVLDGVLRRKARGR